MSDQRQFPDWASFYEQNETTGMPWYYAGLDPDLEQALGALNIHNGTALDLGTGPGSQAIELSKRGFQVTATDLSEAAVRKAGELYLQQQIEQPPLITWLADDILNTGLSGPFDLIFDRGCFHVLPPATRPQYVATVSKLLESGGHLFLKCFSRLQPGEVGPHRFTAEEIELIFGTHFRVCSVTETVYQGQLDPLPKALFCVLQKP